MTFVTPVSFVINIDLAFNMLFIYMPRRQLIPFGLDDPGVARFDLLVSPKIIGSFYSDNQSFLFSFIRLLLKNWVVTKNWVLRVPNNITTLSTYRLLLSIIYRFWENVNVAVNGNITFLYIPSDKLNFFSNQSLLSAHSVYLLIYLTQNKTATKKLIQ